MILKFNNQWLEYNDQTFCNFAEPIRYVYTGANVTATPTSGIYDTTVDLTHTTPQGYDFINYSITGSTLDGDSFKIKDSDVYVEGNYDLHKYNVTTAATNGTVIANPVTGVHGDTITLSNTPDAGFVFDNYSVTGATLKNSNQFDIVYSDVHVIGNFAGDQYNPLGLRPYTFRFQFADTSYNPNSGSWKSGATWTRVSSNPNVWDYHRESADYSNEFAERFNVTNTSCLGGNATGITNMDGTFADNSKFISTAVFDTSNVTIMSVMFNDCSALTTIPLFNTSNVTDMYQFCFRCSNLTSIAQLDTSNVTDMTGMFYECTSLSTIPLLNTSKVTDARFMFKHCTSLTNIPLIDTSSVTDAHGMFAECHVLTTIPALDLHNVVLADGMLQECSGMTSLPDLNLSNCTNMHQFCAMDTALTAIPNITVGKVTDCSGAFWYCYNVASGITAMYNRFTAQSTPPATHAQAFYYTGYSTTTGNAEWRNLPSDWK